MSPLDRLWMRSAACNGRIDMFTSSSEVKRDRALAICATCPVRQECADYALSTEMVGVVVGGVDLVGVENIAAAAKKLRLTGARRWKACQQCGEGYEPSARSSRYCSGECCAVASARSHAEYDARCRMRVAS